MPRIHKRTTNYGTTTEDQMKNALEIIKKGKSIREAAKIYNIPYPTLRRYWKKLDQSIEGNNIIRLTPNYYAKRIFTDEQELALKEYIINCSRMFYGLPMDECRRVAYEMAIINKINVPQNWHKDKMGGLEWMNNFRRRYPDLSLRTPEGCSLSRATSFNVHNLNIFVDKLNKAIARSPAFANGTRIYNLDITGTVTVQKPQKVIAEKGIKSVSKVTSGERGTLVTTCAIISASGQYIPPALVFPRVRYQEHIGIGAPSGTLGLATKTGWMNSKLFLEVMRHFIKCTSSSRENPSLLIYDNCEAHLSIAVIDEAKEHGVTILTVPPHSTNKLQPLDVGVFGQMTAYNSAIDSWMLHNPGKTFSIYQVASCVGIAYQKAMTPSNIISAFKKTGIFPYDREVFREIDFMCSAVTDRDSVIEDVPMLEDINSAIPTSNPPNFEGQLALSTELFDPNQQPSTSYALPDKSNQKDLASSGKNLSPQQFKGYPKATKRSDVSKNSKNGKSMIATDTPEKIEIENRPFNKKLAKMKKNISHALSSSDDEDEEEVILQDSSDSDFELEDLIIGEETLPNFNDNPAEGDYILVKFTVPKKPNVFYDGKILGVNELEFTVSFLRKKR